MKPCVASVGTFDGLHAGHKAIFDKMNELAEEKRMTTRAITFLNHPLSVVKPEKCPKWAAGRARNLKALEGYVDRVSQMNFTPELAKLTAREFMGMIRERYGVDTLVMGYDNRFGSDNLASREDYVAAGRDAGLNVVFVEAVAASDGKPVSSTRLREAISRFDYPVIEEFCGKGPTFSGKVVEGKKLGRKLGFPTLNIEVGADVVQLPDGVYWAYVELEADADLSLGVLSVGPNPTVGDSGKKYEIYMVGKKLGSMYGKEVTFFPVFYMREQKKFETLDDLRKAIKMDVRVARIINDQIEPDTPEEIYYMMLVYKRNGLTSSEEDNLIEEMANKFKGREDE